MSKNKSPCHATQKIISIIMAVFMLVSPWPQITASANDNVVDGVIGISQLSIDISMEAILEAQLALKEETVIPVEMSIPDEFTSSLNKEFSGYSLVDAGSENGYYWTAGINSMDLKVAVYNSNTQEINYKVDISGESINSIDKSISYQIVTELLSENELKALDPDNIISKTPIESPVSLGYTSSKESAPKNAELFYNVVYILKTQDTPPSVLSESLGIQKFAVNLNAQNSDEVLVKYTIRYLMEKPNIEGDPGLIESNYQFHRSESYSAPVGTFLDYSANVSLTPPGTTEFHHGGTAILKETGTVINVYFSRILYTLQFNLAPYANGNATMDFNGSKYTQTANNAGVSVPSYSVQVKYQQDISDIFPVNSNAQISREAKDGKTLTKFVGWKLSSFLYENNPTTFNANMVPSWSDNTKRTRVLTAAWEEGKTAKYTIRYMMEKPNITGDPGLIESNYQFHRIESYTATVGTFLDYSADVSLTPPGTTEFHHGGTATLQETGTVINVYFSRILYTLQFNLAPYANGNATMDFKGNSYTQTANNAGVSVPSYSIQAKYQQDISDSFPVNSNAQISREAKDGKTLTKFVGWKLSSFLYENNPTTFNANMVPSWTLTGNRTRVLTAAWEEAKTVTVRFEILGEGGSINAGQTTQFTAPVGTAWSAAAITAPSITTLEGYEFSAWDAFPTTIVDDTVIYGRFVKKLGSVPVNAVGYTGDYDGNSHGVIVTSSAVGAVVRYGTTIDDYSLTQSPTILNVSDGPLTVYYEVTCTGYLPVKGSVILRINPKYINFSDMGVSISNLSKIYGDSDPAISLAGWPQSLSGPDFNVQLYRDSGDIVGTYVVRANISSLNSNYAVSQNPKTGILTINKRTVTIAANNATYTYDRRLHTFSGIESVTGLLPNHTLNGVTTTVVSAVAVSTYFIDVVTTGWSITSGAQDLTNNYQLSTVRGMMTITPPLYVPSSPGGTSSPDTNPVSLKTIIDPSVPLASAQTAISESKVPLSNIPNSGGIPTDIFAIIGVMLVLVSEILRRIGNKSRR